MKTIAVIGSGYGDEGKGRTVDDLLSGVDPREALVVRHNSSAQAGHTVDHGDRRHVFSHFGSGTLRGVPTYLGPKFVINPAVFASELTDLVWMGIVPRLQFSPRCIVTTPYDTAANQVAEVMRGSLRHGSCGIGFGNTIARDLVRPVLSLRLPVQDRATLEGRLRSIRAYYLARLNGLEAINHPAAAFLADDDPNLEPWIHQLAEFQAFADPVHESSFANRETVIFEGAQGLMLDQNHGSFPYVTRCNTGLGDVMPLASAMGRPSVAPNYVLRPYMTRHGAGPLPFEVDAPPVPGFSDATNQPNEWQGQLRFGLVYLTRVKGAIAADFERAGDAYSDLIEGPHFTMTCADQLGPAGKVQLAGNQCLRVEDLAREIAGTIGARSVSLTYGARAGNRVVIDGKAAA